MSLLDNAPCVIWYNGVKFPTETRTTGMDIRPVYDTAGRAVVHVLYRITVQSTIGQANQLAGVPTDFTLASLRRLLTAPGGELHYEQVGLGNLTINVPAAGPSAGASGPARDVVWGPKPQMLQWQPLGQMACELTWQVEVAIPECDAAAYQFALMEFCFTVGVAIDQAGYSTRTVKGHVCIPQTRKAAGDRTLSDQADRLREQVCPLLPAGWKRTQDYDLSEDKCRLDFRVVDVEQGGNPPPPGVVDAQASETVSTYPGTSAKAGATWQVVIKASYELSPGRSRVDAWGLFRALVMDRLFFAGAGWVGSVGAGKKPRRSFVMPAHLEMSEPEIYGKRSASFTATYKLLANQDCVLQCSGLWRPVTGADWNAWAYGAGKTDGYAAAVGPRGRAGLYFDQTVDAIIDLCAGGAALNVKEGGYVVSTPAPPPDGGGYDMRVASLPYAGETPPAESSWLAYQCRVTLEVADDTYQLRLLPPSGYSLSTQGGAATSATGDEEIADPGPPGDFDPPGGTGTLEWVAAPPDPGVVIQRRAAPARWAYLEGFAVRAGWPVETPELVAQGGAPAARANRAGHGEGITSFVLDDWFGVPIHAARWRLRYALGGPAVGADTPATPFEG